MDVRGTLRLSDDELTLRYGSSNQTKIEVDATSTNSVTLTLPPVSASDSLVGRTATQTLTNKTLTTATLTTPDINGGTADSLTSFSLRDTSAAFDLTLAAVSSTALTAGRTLTLDVDEGSRLFKLQGDFIKAGSGQLTLSNSGALSFTMPTGGGTLVNLSATQTLTNKTLTAPSITAATITVNSLDVSAADDYTVFGSVGANTLTVGGASTTVLIAGNLQVDGTTTTVNSTTLDVADANITISSGGNDAASEGAGITIDRTSTAGSLIYKDASATKFAIGAAGSEVDVVGISSTQTLTNKTLTSPTVTDLTATGNHFVRGVLTLQNTSGSQPVLRMSEDPDNGTAYVELKAPEDLSDVSYTLTLPTTDGGANEVLTTDGAGVLSWSAVATTVTAARGDIIFRAAGGDDNLAIGTKGKRLKAGTDDPEWGWDGVNAVSSANYTILDNDGYDIIAVSTGASDRTIDLPTAADNAGRKLHFVKTDSGAGKVIIDGEGTEAINSQTTYKLESQYSTATMYCTGAAWLVLDSRHNPVAFTPSLVTMTTNITATGIKWRVGDRGFYEVKYAFTGTNTQGTATIDMPTGETMDAAKMVDTAAGGSVGLGQVAIMDADGSGHHSGHVTYNTSTRVRLMVGSASGTYTTATFINGSGPVPITWASGDTMVARWNAPIVEFA